MFSSVSFTVLAAALSLAFDNAAIASAHRSRDLDSMLENSYIVKLKDGANATSHINSLPFLFSVDDPNSPITHWWPEHFRGYSGKFVGATLDAIKASPDVEYVENNVLLTTAAIQRNAPWNLQAICTRVPVGGTNVNGMTYTYNYDEPMGEDIDIYVVDTGVYTEHNEFEGRATFGWAAPGLEMVDTDGHGTHVAAIAAGKTYGVAKKANIIAVKIFDGQGVGLSNDLIAAVNWILDNVKSTGKRSIVVIAVTSVGKVVEGIDNAVINLISTDIPVVVAAGNEGRDASYSSPASVPLAIVVGASGITNTMWQNSNFGEMIHVFAPGVGITSAWITGPSSTHVESGTSMAAGHVAGLAAYFLSMDPWMTPSSISWKIWQIGTKNVLRAVPYGTNNLLAYNGASG